MAAVPAPRPALRPLIAPPAGPRPAIDVLVRSAGDWHRVLAHLHRQRVAPNRVIVESAVDPRSPAPEGAVLVPPGAGLAAVSGDVVCLLDDRDRPSPAWLATVAEAAAQPGVDVVQWGVLHLRPDGIVAGVDIPPVTGRAPRAVRSGYAVRRALAGADGCAPAGAHTRGVPRLLVRRCGTGDPFPAATPERPATPLVSVVLPVRDAAATLAEQLTALAAQDHTGSWELVVVDNGSTDGSLEIVAGLAHRFAACRVVSATGHGNPGYARNAGVRAARGELLLFCDADDAADTGWLRAMVEASRDADLIGGALDCTRLSPALLDEQPVPMPEQQDFLPFARSANCGVWRDVLADIGGWGEHFRGGGEDVDLSWRAQLSGYRLAYAPDARIGYRLRPTLRGVARQKWRYGLSGAPLYRTYRYAGYQRRPWRAVVRSWLWLALHLPDLARPGTARRRWVRYVVRLAGFAAGSIRHRVAFL